MQAMQSARAELAFRRWCSLGEGSLWDEQRRRLLWVDIIQQHVMLFDPEARCNHCYAVGQDVGTVVPCESGKLLVALRSGVARLDPQCGELEPLCEPEPDKPGNRLNDGKCDPRGRFRFGSIVEDGHQGNGALYSLGPDLALRRQLTGVDISNGIVWSRDGRTLYYIDTPTQLVRAFDFDLDAGSLGEEREVFRFAPELGAPDGMTIDEEDQLWVAMWGGHKVLRVCPRSARITFEVEVPAARVTSCAFGGPGLDELYITTARVGLTEAELAGQPLAGSLFRVRLPFRGRPAQRFADGHGLGAG